MYNYKLYFSFCIFEEIEMDYIFMHEIMYQRVMNQGHQKHDQQDDVPGSDEHNEETEHHEYDQETQNDHSHQDSGHDHFHQELGHDHDAEETEQRHLMACETNAECVELTDCHHPLADIYAYCAWRKLWKWRMHLCKWKTWSILFWSYWLFWFRKWKMVPWRKKTWVLHDLFW